MSDEWFGNWYGWGGWLAGFLGEQRPAASGKVARHIVVGTAWERVESRVEKHPDTWPVPAQRAFGWVRPVPSSSLTLPRQVVAVLDVAGKLFMEGTLDLMVVKQS